MIRTNYACRMFDVEQLLYDTVHSSDSTSPWHSICVLYFCMECETDLERRMQI